MLSLSNHTPLARPAFLGAIAKLGEHARGLLGLLELLLGLVQLASNDLHQPGVARQPEDVIHGVLFAPSHQFLAAETRVGAQNNLHLRPHSPQRRDDPLHFLQRARRGVDVRGPQPCAQQVLARKDVQRQVAILPVIAVKKPSFLIAVQRIVGGVQVQHDALRLALLRLDVEFDQRLVDGLLAHHDLLITCLRGGVGRRQLQAVQRALARARLAAVLLPPARRTFQIPLATQQRQQRIALQLVVIVEILVAQRQAIDPLLNQLAELVLHSVGAPVIGKTGGELAHDPGSLLDLAQQ